MGEKLILRARDEEELSTELGLEYGQLLTQVVDLDIATDLDTRYGHEGVCMEG